MLTKVDAVTEEVEIEKFALLAPAATVTLDGTLAAAELDDSVTTAPAAGAGALRVTVPVEDLPPVTLAGFSDTADTAGPTGGGFTPIAENWNTLSRAALSCTVVVSCGNVVTGKLALVAPPGTMTLAGTLAASGRTLPRFTATPAAGAGPASVTVPVAAVPPTTLVGFTVSAVSSGRLGYSVKGADRVTPPPLTEIVTTVGWVTGAVTILTLPMPLTAATVIVLGTLARAGLLLVICMIWSKPTPSADVTTACEPLVVDIGLISKDVGAGPGVSVIGHCAVTPL